MSRGTPPRVRKALFGEGVTSWCTSTEQLVRLRPSAILRACQGLSAKVTNERMRKMMRFGLVRRVVTGKKPPSEVEYLLTSFGRRLLGILDEVCRLQDEVDHAGQPFE